MLTQVLLVETLLYVRRQN